MLLEQIIYQVHLAQVKILLPLKKGTLVTMTAMGSR